MIGKVFRFALVAVVAAAVVKAIPDIKRFLEIRSM